MLTKKQREYYLDGLSIYTETLPLPTQILDGRLCGIGLSRLKRAPEVKTKAHFQIKGKIARTCSVCGETDIVFKSGHVPTRCRRCANGINGRARWARNRAN
jgi:hypothetical protein